mmetsp:Transcript_51170/g.160971  ORF Transcript_51170/g.160971 Transcript_51170/m.160971 type:complete len:329 (-) Transcript_51170:169-1155(-)
MLLRRDGTGPKMDWDCRAALSCSSASRSRALRRASSGATRQPGARASASARGASDCHAQPKAPRISMTAGCAESVEPRNSSLSQLRQKGLRKSASRGTPLRSRRTLSALKSPCLLPCSAWKRQFRRAACRATSERSGATCSQACPFLCCVQGARVRRAPTGCERSNMRRRSPSDRQPSRCSKTATSHGGPAPRCCVGGSRQRKAASGKTAWTSDASAGASRRSRAASRASLRQALRGRVHFTTRPAWATRKRWLRPPQERRRAPAASARPKSTRRPSLPKTRCRAGPTSKSLTRPTCPGSPWTWSSRLAGHVPAPGHATGAGGLQHRQ